MPAIPRPMDVGADEDIYSTWGSFDSTPSTLLSIVVRHFPNVLLTTHNLSLLMLTASPATICQPRWILDVENKTEFEELVLEFLTSTEVMEEVLSCAKLMKSEDDSEKAPGLNSASMKVFLRQHASQNEFSTSEVCKDVGAEVGHTFGQVKHVSIKRRKDEGVTMIADKIGEGSKDLSSLWCEDYPLTALAEDYS
ncbi:hypothetical protein PIB30_012772 [Stylosanthes scabra]|uniref:Uncharacterized protein n=1 Tax=Stylosanthes scabra TaxID=79078 RepID=A0ABU6S6K7_9FABA|nr:hypothetical protein [Stylosanthes scabra]